MPRKTISDRAPTERPNRQPRGLEARERILDATLRLLARGGPGAVSQRAVAREAGVSLGATTYYFANQREMLAAAYELHLSRTHERVDRLLPEPGAIDPVAMAEGLTAYLETRVIADRARYLAGYEIQLELARDPELRAQLSKANDASDLLAVDLIGSIGDAAPEEDAHLLIALLQGLTLRWLAAGAESDFKERVPALMRRFAEMLQTPA